MDKLVNIKNGLRGAIAIVLSFWLSHFLKINYAYWVVLTTVVILQPSVGATLVRAQQRVLGTILGVLIGALLISLFHNQVIPITIILLLLVFLALWLMLINYVWSLFFATAALIIIIGSKIENPWLFVRDRLGDTILGVIIGLLLSLTLWPSWARLRFRENILQSMKQAQELFNLMLNSLIKEDHDFKKITELKLDLSTTLEKNRQYFVETRYENFSPNTNSLCVLAVLNCLELIRDIIVAIHGLRRSGFDFYQEPLAIDFINQYKQSVNKIFNNFIQYLDKTEKSTELLPVIYAGELPSITENYSELYLRRNLNHIFIELNHLQQALSNFYAK
ncbi:MAG: hypothetical protein A3E87_10800 [Gammaproteobacteria bacterium RIFCSPHIGHO2_12_FULL_35_23]|nr:MAG: hypothetical protein A3E87_10800 [Gammaproteobacteria bacterium RIFCSPHIGHO2_12_FULL_35_23]